MRLCQWNDNFVTPFSCCLHDRAAMICRLYTRRNMGECVYLNRSAGLFRGGVELGAQVAAGVAVGAGSNFFGGAGAYHAAAVNSAFGTHVNDVVGTFYHVHVVLDD